MPRWTNFPNGITSLGIPTFGTGFLPPFTGNYFFVEETATAGLAAGAGTAQQPFNTIQQALAECTAGNNDVIFLTGTVHVSASQGSIAWNKNNTHLVGLCAPLKRGKRARISSSGSTPFSYLVDVGANGCYFKNFGTFYGFPTTGSTTPVCWRDNSAGGRNDYDLVELLGFGDGTATTGTAAQAGARSMLITGSTGEITLRSCVLGVDTEPRTAANYNLEISGGAPRITIEDTDFEAYCGSGGTGGGFLLIGSAGIDRRLEIKGESRFMNATASGASTFTQAMSLSGSAGGFVDMGESVHGWGFTHWETSASGTLIGAHAVITQSGAGIALEVTT